MVKIVKRMYRAFEIVDYFSRNEWHFKSDNLIALHNKLNPTDQKEFNFDMTSIDWRLMVGEWYLGVRKFLLKEPEETIPFARKRMQR